MFSASVGAGLDDEEDAPMGSGLREDFARVFLVPDLDAEEEFHDSIGLSKRGALKGVSHV